MTERGKTESPHDRGVMARGGQEFEPRSDPETKTFLESVGFLSNRSQYRLGIARTLYKDQKKLEKTRSLLTSENVPLVPEKCKH